MSESEDCELQELVQQTLEKSGTLSKLRAELRASVFCALEKTGFLQSSAEGNTNLQNFAKTTDGVLLLCLIREFLEYFGLSFTKSVFDPELASYGIRCDCTDRSNLSSQLNVTSNSDVSDTPILGQMLKIIRNIQGERKFQNIDSCMTKESNKLTNCKSSDTSTEYLPLQSVNNFSNESESKKKVKIEADRENPIISKTENFHNLTGKSTQATITKETDTVKHNLSSLDDLPPLTSSYTSSKNNSSSSNKSKQMNMLKAALKDTITDVDNSVSSEDDENNVEDQDSNKLDESVVEESQVTAEDSSS